MRSDKARAAVDAMERNMGSMLATKQDLLLLASKEDVLLLRHDVALLSQDISGLRTQIDRETDRGISQLQQSIDAFRDAMTQKLTAFERGLTMKFGLMFVVGCVLTIAAIRL